MTVADAQGYKPDGLYDVIISTGPALRGGQGSVISRMQKATCEGGINVISLWSDYTRSPNATVRANLQRRGGRLRDQPL